MDLCRVDAVGGSEVEGVERLHLGESGFAEPLADHGLVARRLLGAEDHVSPLAPALGCLDYRRPIGQAIHA